MKGKGTRGRGQGTRAKPFDGVFPDKRWAHGKGKGKREMRGSTRWESFFSEDRRTINAPPSAFSKYAAAMFKRYGARAVLDLGCGAGRDTMVLADKGLVVIGADLAWSGLQIARNKARSKKVVGLVQSDSRKLPFHDSSFGGIYCFGLLHEFTGRGAASSVAGTMSEVHRVLRPGGLLALSVLAGDPRAGLPHVRLFTEDMFDRSVRDLAIIEKRRCDDVGCTGHSDYCVWRGFYRKTKA